MHTQLSSQPRHAVGAANGAPRRLDALHLCRRIRYFLACTIQMNKLTLPLCYCPHASYLVPAVTEQSSQLESSMPARTPCRIARTLSKLLPWLP